MNNKNLIPANRLQIKATQQSIQRWTLINTAYLCLLAVAGITFAAYCGDSASRLKPAEINADLNRSNTTLASLRQKAVVLRAHVEADQEVSHSPDWSILLRALSNATDENVVLNSVDCTGDVITGKTTGPVPTMFRIAGLGRSQQSVTQFVLKLERLHFFSYVRLVQTTPQMERGCNCIGFDLLCSLTPSQGGQP